MSTRTATQRDDGGSTDEEGPPRKWARTEGDGSTSTNDSRYPGGRTKRRFKGYRTHYYARYIYRTKKPKPQPKPKQQSRRVAFKLAGYGRRAGYANRRVRRRFGYQQRLKARYRNQFAGRFPRGSDGSKAYFGESWATANADQKRHRQLLGFRGAGDYRSWARYIPRGLGALAGGGIGYSAGGPRGAATGVMHGWNAGAQLSKAIGWGDYGGPSGGDVEMNDLFMPRNQRLISIDNTNNRGDFVFTHTEFIQNVVVEATGVGYTPFQVQSFGLNPGLEGTFPFLSQLATNFELFQFIGLAFQYKPSYGEGGSNQLGKVLMCTNYDADSMPFTNSQAMANYQWCTPMKPSVGGLHGVETAPPDKPQGPLMYVRRDADSPGPAPAGQKPRIETDLGRLNIATEGIPSSAEGPIPIGELWVSYTIRLSRASLQSTQKALEVNNFTANHVMPILSWTPTASYYGAENSLPITMSSPAVDTIRFTFPRNVVAGRYLINVLFNIQFQNFKQVQCSGGVMVPFNRQGMVGAPYPLEGRTTLATPDPPLQPPFYYYVATGIQDIPTAPGTMGSTTVVMDILSPDSEQAWVQLSLGTSALPIWTVPDIVNFGVTITQISQEAFSGLLQD